MHHFNRCHKTILRALTNWIHVKKNSSVPFDHILCQITWFDLRNWKQIIVLFFILHNFTNSCCPPNFHTLTAQDQGSGLGQMVSTQWCIHRCQKGWRWDPERNCKQMCISKVISNNVRSSCSIWESWQWCVSCFFNLISFAFVCVCVPLCLHVCPSKQ